MRQQAWVKGARSSVPYGVMAGILLAIVAVPRVWAALWDGGIFWPDELFQTMEPAHKVAFGYGVLPWEFREGARSWLFPGLLGLVWKGAAALGATSSEGLVSIAKVGMASLSLGGVWAGMSLARRLAGDRAALLAGVTGGLCPPLIVFGSRCMSEMASAPLVLGAALLVELGGKRRSALAGVAASLSIFLRYQNGLVVLGFLVLLVARKRWQDVRAYAASAAVVGLVGGLLDWPTWGSPFRSFWVYVKYNLIDGRASHFGTAPFGYFAEHLGTSIGASFGILVLGVAVSLRRAPGLIMIVLVYVLAHSLVPHKELRFIMPIVPLAMSLAAVGLVDLMNGLGPSPWPTAALGLACVAQMNAQLRAPTRAQLGLGTTDWVVWHSGEDYFRMTEQAAKVPDLCGVIYVANSPEWTGGYTYLHRAVPIFFDTHPEHLDEANAVVGSPTEALPEEWKSVSTNGRYALWRRPGTCASPAPGYVAQLGGR